MLHIFFFDVHSYVFCGSMLCVPCVFTTVLLLNLPCNLWWLFICCTVQFSGEIIILNLRYCNNHATRRTAELGSHSFSPASSCEPISISWKNRLKTDFFLNHWNKTTDLWLPCCSWKHWPCTAQHPEGWSQSCTPRWHPCWCKMGFLSLRRWPSPSPHLHPPAWHPLEHIS